MTSSKSLFVALWSCGSGSANPSLEIAPAVSVSPGGILSDAVRKWLSVQLSKPVTLNRVPG